MTYRVLTGFKAKTDRGEMEVRAGQIITLAKDQALMLINKGKIIPAEKAAYKIYSNILQAYLWIVDTDEDIWALKNEGTAEPIYTADEVRKLKGISKEGLKQVHSVKEVFEGSKVKDVRPAER
ncbi:MAG: hypothetical protein M0Z75_08890 [Nitrospiraceae bacterium]|nr:hypothetical protein [Nitrospiraceae bacterium]